MKVSGRFPVSSRMQGDSLLINRLFLALEALKGSGLGDGTQAKTRPPWCSLEDKLDVGF